jgi:hypothetical protein
MNPLFKSFFPQRLSNERNFQVTSLSEKKQALSVSLGSLLCPNIIVSYFQTPLQVAVSWDIAFNFDVLQLLLSIYSP